MRVDRNSFNGGELSDWLDSRSDLYKRASGCRTLENCHVVRYGGARRRSGFVLAGKAAADTVRLEGFNFSRTTSYVLEFSQFKIRFWNRDGSPVESSPGTPYELTTPYLEADLFRLDFAQQNDVIIVTHPAHHPQCLKHAGPTSWEIYPVPWLVRPWSDFNDTATTVTVSKSGADTLVTFSANTLSSAWTDSYLRVRRAVDSTLETTSFRNVWRPPDLPAEYDTVEFVKSTLYDPDPATNGRKSHVFLRDGYASASGHHTLFRCISPYDGTGSSSDPNDYPSNFAPGIIALGPILVTGRWEFETKGTWTGTWRVERSYDSGSTWEEVGTAFSINDSNTLISEEEDPDRPALFRVLALSSTFLPSESVYFRALDGSITAEYQIQSVYSATSAKVIPGANADDFPLGEASTDWSDDAFSEKNGFPAVTTFHESRLFFAATDAEPERLWASKTDAFFSFPYGTEAADAFTFVLNANRYNAIVWLCSQQALLIGTTGAEWSSFTTEGGPMTPETTNFHLHTHHGSDPNPGLVLSDAAVFVQRQGRKIREFAPSPQGLGIYASPDLTELAEHITRGGIKQLAKRDSPDTELFALRNDGTIANMIFERSQQIYAWSRWTTSGQFTSIATTYGDGEDDAVFVAVVRNVGGTDQTFIEYLAPDGIRTEENATAADFISLDHAQTTTSLAAEYAGKILAAQDGFEDLGDFTVAGDGTVPLSKGKSNPVVGFNFVTDIEPTPFELGGHANKVSHQSAHIRLRYSSNFKIGTSDRSRFNAIAIAPADHSPVNVDKVISAPGKFDRNSSIVIRKDRPGPLSVVSIDLETQTGTL